MLVSSELGEEQEGAGGIQKWILESQEGEEEGKVGRDWKRGWSGKLFYKEFIEIHCFAGGKGEGQVAEFQ